jgi:hypothetical protein
VSSSDIRADLSADGGATLMTGALIVSSCPDLLPVWLFAPTPKEAQRVLEILHCPDQQRPHPQSLPERGPTSGPSNAAGNRHRPRQVIDLHPLRPPLADRDASVSLTAHRRGVRQKLGQTNSFMPQK